MGSYVQPRVWGDQSYWRHSRLEPCCRARWFWQNQGVSWRFFRSKYRPLGNQVTCTNCAPACCCTEWWGVWPQSYHPPVEPAKGSFRCIQFDKLVGQETNRNAHGPGTSSLIQNLEKSSILIFSYWRNVEGWSVFTFYLVGFDSLLEVGKAASFGCESNCLHRLHVWTRVSAKIRV